MAKKILKTDEEWRKQLDEEQFNVCRLGATEPPFSGKYTFEKIPGMYVCACCGSELFSSDTKFDSGSGWPSFWDIAKSGKVELHQDNKIPFQPRTEVTCASCGAHLGHVFDDGPQDKTGKRYCINSCALDLKTKK